MTMADFDGEGASETIAGAATKALAEISIAEATAMPPSPSRPPWMLTRYPVSREEFARLNAAAAEPGPPAEAPEEGAQEDSAPEAEPAEVEYPEDAANGAAPAAAPAAIASFDGIPQTSWQPPDCTIAAGRSDILLAVNADLAGYTKTGVLRFRWPNMSTLFQNVLPTGASIFDPRLGYDHYAQRWIIVAGARRATPAGSWVMVGVSQGQDPAGAYWVWALDAALDGSTPTNNWADYPMLGFDTQAIYLGLNMFAVGGGYQYAKIRILNKGELYAGGTGSNHFARWFDFWGLRNADNSMAFTVQPAAHFRGSGGNPPAYLVNALWPSGTSLSLWTLTNPLGSWTGGAPSLTRSAVNCVAYDLPPDGQQPSTTTLIETDDSRLLNAVYQFAGNAQRLWTCHTTKFTWPGEPEARSVVQWYEIDVPSKTVTQQGRFGATGRYYFYPVIQTDLSRDAYVAFGRSASDEFAQMRHTGRRTTDPANTLQGSALVSAGVAAYTGGRWGDYFGISRDPADPQQVWFYGQRAGSGNTWATRAGAARF
jgi:hypothetical protein